jgi:hypothetical protein
MKKPSRFLPLLALSFLLAAFSIPPRPASAQKPVITQEITSQIHSDGSGTFSMDITFDKNAIALFQSDLSNSGANICDTFKLVSVAGLEWTEEKVADGTRCHGSRPFQNLDGLKSLTENALSPASFQRLEIANGHLYYDLPLGIDFSSESTANNAYVIHVNFILEMPGDIVSTNATKTSGRTLTWDLTTLNRSSHIQAESKLGGSVLEMDSTLAVIGVLILLGCCCVLLLAAGGVGFFLTRRKSASGKPAAAGGAGTSNP